MTTTSLRLSSQTIRPETRIPRRHAYRGEGENVSPDLSWPKPPAGTAEQVVVCEDADAPRARAWVHWLVYSIPPGVTALPEDLGGNPTLEVVRGAKQGVNSWGDLGWGGPFPPPGHGVHHYHFRVFALDRALKLAPGADWEQVEREMSGHVLAQGELVGTYER
ncbi:MAG: YbhB/YbcL family Raf kinase inhibitor-like protein [Planctomycetota bacterium]